MLGTFSVAAAEVVRTAADSRVEIGFVDGSGLVVGPGSEVALDVFEVHEKSLVRAVIGLLGGILRARVGALPDDVFEVRGRTAIASVRGTEWIVQGTAERTSVFVVDGTVAVSPLATNRILRPPARAPRRRRRQRDATPALGRDAGRGRDATHDGSESMGRAGGLPAPGLRRPRLAAGLAPLLELLFVAAGAARERLPVPASVDVRTLDGRLRMRGSRPADPQVVIVAIDEASLATLGCWPVSREVVARAVRLLDAAGAAAPPPPASRSSATPSTSRAGSRR